MKMIHRLAGLLGCSTGMSLREKAYAAFAALVAILVLMSSVRLAAAEFTVSLLVLASMGASAFLLFAVPHSPMAQPWPLMGGHVLSAAIGVLSAGALPGPEIATAVAVALSIFVMHWLRCLHPPAAATAMIAVLGGPEVAAIGWKFCYEMVAFNAGLMLLLGLAINNLIPGRRYPLRQSHHAHHAQFQASGLGLSNEALREEDFAWALRQMDAVIDVSEEDLVDLYEFALEHARARATRNDSAAANEETLEAGPVRCQHSGFPHNRHRQ